MLGGRAATNRSELIARLVLFRNPSGHVVEAVQRRDILQKHDVLGPHIETARRDLKLNTVAIVALLAPWIKDTLTIM